MQKQLENQLPGLRKDGGGDKNGEYDGNQKEKLTLKIVKTPDGTQTIEQKTPKINEKDRHPLYRVLSRNEENPENNDQVRLKTIILKRNTQNDLEKVIKTKRLHLDDSTSETSESNLSSHDSSSINAMQRRKSVRDSGPKRRKSVKNPTVDIPLFDSSPTSSSSSSKRKQKEIPENVVGEKVASKLVRKRSRSKSVNEEQDIRVQLPVPKILPTQKIPPGTTSVLTLRDDDDGQLTNPVKSRPRIMQRSHSFNKSTVANSNKHKRRLSTASTPSQFVNVANEKLVETILSLKQQTRNRNSLKRPSTPAVASTQKNDQTRTRVSTTEGLNPEIVIKSEPISDDEENIVRRKQITLNDLAELVDERPSRRKTIVISTSDNSNDSFQNQVSRARKTFPKPTNRNTDLIQTQQVRNAKAMICIPSEFSHNDVASTSQSVNQINLESTPFISLQNSQLYNRIVNGNAHESPPMNINNNTTASNPSLSRNNSRRSSINSSIINDLGSVSQKLPMQSPTADMPRLVQLPKSSGVFTNEGNTFERESGSVSALFSQNAHRMTDYFKSLLIDTIGAISNGVGDAQIVLLKLEQEKLKQTLQNVKIEHQLKIEKLKKDYADEIKTIKISNGKF